MKKATLILVTILAVVISCKQDKGEADNNSGSDSTTVETYRANITLPPPDEDDSHVKYSKVIGWPEGKTPSVPEGFSIQKFASGTKSPRNIYVAPNGDIFVAFANTESKGIKKKVTDEVTVAMSRSTRKTA